MSLRLVHVSLMWGGVVEMAEAYKTILNKTVNVRIA